MKSLKVVLGVLAGVVILAIIGIAFLVNSIVSGGQKDRITALASQKLGTRVDFDSYGLDFASILRLQPAVSVKGLTVANPPGFPARNMIEAKEVSANLDLRAALSKKIEVGTLVIREPRILIESPAKGPTNLEALMDALNKAEDSPEPAAQTASAAGSNLSVGVGSVVIENGTILLASSGADPQEALQKVGIRVTEIRKGSPSRLELTTQIGESANSTVTINGTAGPLGDKTLPLEGNGAVQLALAEFPIEQRRRLLGELASAPGPDSRVVLDLALKGDLYKTLNGTGAIDFSQFFIGSNQASRLALSGKAPLEMRLEDTLSGGPAEIESRNATLKLGSGEWAGNLKVARKGDTLTGGIDGAVRGVDVNQMLTSFANSPDVMYGTGTIPRFQIAFSGANSAELQRSLNGNGSLNVSNGRFKGLNVLATIERALGGRPTGTGEFSSFTTNFSIRNQALQLTGIEATGPGINITGQGTVGFNEALNITLQSSLSGAAGDLLKARTGGIVSSVTVPVTITGTVSNPQVRPNIAGLAKSAAKDAVTGAVGNVLGGFLGRGKKN